MKSLTVRLPENLVADIENESRSRRVSKSDVVRDRLGRSPGAPASGASMRPVLEDILKESWKVKVPTQRRGFRSPHKQKLAEIIRAKKLHR
jgi:Arc/MetJ-type ribon-helix-helix transcriptional regulator